MLRNTTGVVDGWVLWYLPCCVAWWVSRVSSVKHAWRTAPREVLELFVHVDLLLLALCTWFVSTSGTCGMSKMAEKVPSRELETLKMYSSWVRLGLVYSPRRTWETSLSDLTDVPSVPRWSPLTNYSDYKSHYSSNPKNCDETNMSEVALWRRRSMKSQPS